MATKRTLIMTTTASEADASTFPTVTGIAAVSTEPDGTSVKIVTKVADTWQKYDAVTSAWKDVATQSLTAASVASEGNSVAEINAIPASALIGFAGKKVNFAIAYTTANDAQPSLTSITINGETGATVSEETVASNTVTLGTEPVEILSIDVDKTEAIFSRLPTPAAIRGRTMQTTALMSPTRQRKRWQSALSTYSQRRRSAAARRRSTASRLSIARTA